MLHPIANAVGVGLTAVGGGGAGLLWLTGRAHAQSIVTFAQSPPGATEAAGNTLLGGLVLGIATLVINGLFATRKARIETANSLAERKIDADVRFAAQELRTVQMVSDARIEALKAMADAKLIADAEINALKADLARAIADGSRRDDTLDRLAMARAADESRVTT